MKRIFSIILFICIALFANAFIVDGLCYNINGTSVYVTYQSSESPNYPNLSGDIIIPSTVTYNGTTYSVTSIGSNAFLGCSNLTSVTIGDSVRAVGSYAFKDCVGLTSVIIGNSVTSIGYEAFEKCTNLTKVDVRDIAAWCNIDFIGGSHSNPLFFAKNLYLNGTIVSNLIIPNSVNTIKELVFNGCTCITSVTIPNSVTSIGSYAFLGCTGLTSVTIPNSVTVIGGSAFSDCTSLTSVIWNAKACNDCTTNSPFKNLTYIQSFTFGNEVEQIPALLCYGLTGLTSVIIPNSIAAIGGSAFQACSGLKTAIIGENVTSIGEKAFKNCSFLENLVALRERPIIINSNVFEGVPKASCDLHVREGSKIRYENQDVWKDFLIIVEDAEDWADVSGGGSSGVYGDVNGDGVVTAADVTAVYDVLLGSQ